MSDSDTKPQFTPGPPAMTEREEFDADTLISEIEDYIGGNVEGVETIDRMSLTRFLRSKLQDAYAAGAAAERERAAKVCDRFAFYEDDPAGYARQCAAAIRRGE